jgi:hypothetical protein
VGSNQAPATKIAFLSVTSANPATIRIDKSRIAKTSRLRLSLKVLETSHCHSRGRRFESLLPAIHSKELTGRVPPTEVQFSLRPGFAGSQGG